MTSTIAWLDTSAEQRRKANEIISLFMQQESRDELGIGTIRDALSNLLFPGTSVLLTRARYCLFVPWCFQVRSAAIATGSKHLAAAQWTERLLVETLIEEEPESGAGVIGRRVGRQVRNLPSTIYWGTLTTWGITPRASMSLLGARDVPPDSATELETRADLDWHPDLPTLPTGFPHTTDGGFALRRDEAEWLRDRILDTCTGTALEALVTPDADRSTRLAQVAAARGPWDIPALADRHDVRQADLFSLVVEGATLLYNLMVAERCESEGLTSFDGLVDHYRELMYDWAESLIADGGHQSWDLVDFWKTVSQSVKPPPLTRSFIESWAARLNARGGVGAADDRELRGLVERRERRKGQQSRLANPRMLPTWSGESAAGRLTYRWGTLRVLTQDLLLGLDA